VLRVKGVMQLPSAPGELLCFQRVEDKAELKLFPLPEGFNWSPIAVLIGSWLPAEDFQAAADASFAPKTRKISKPETSSAQPA